MAQNVFDNLASDPDVDCRTLTLALGGLEIMNDDPKETNVVFVDVDKDAARQQLERILFALQQQLDEVGLLDNKERRRLFLVDETFAPKLHATILNTRLRRTNNKLSANATAFKPQTRKLTPAEQATHGSSITTPTGQRSVAALAAAQRKAAGLKRDYGERLPLDAGKHSGRRKQLCQSDFYLSCACQAQFLNIFRSGVWAHAKCVPFTCQSEGSSTKPVVTTKQSLSYLSAFRIHLSDQQRQQRQRQLPPRLSRFTSLQGNRIWQVDACRYPKIYAAQSMQALISKLVCFILFGGDPDS